MPNSNHFPLIESDETKQDLKAEPFKMVWMGDVKQLTLKGGIGYSKHPSALWLWSDLFRALLPRVLPLTQHVITKQTVWYV